MGRNITDLLGEYEREVNLRYREADVRRRVQAAINDAERDYLDRQTIMLNNIREALKNEQSENSKIKG